MAQSSSRMFQLVVHFEKTIGRPRANAIRTIVWAVANVHPDVLDEVAHLRREIGVGGEKSFVLT